MPFMVFLSRLIVYKSCLRKSGKKNKFSVNLEDALNRLVAWVVLKCDVRTSTVRLYCRNNMHAHTTTYHEIKYKDRPIYVVYSGLNQNLFIKYTIYIVYTTLCKPVINYLEDLNIFFIYRLDAESTNIFKAT